MNRTFIHNKKAGFLLVEAIIAIVIILMVTATSISLLVMGHRAINLNKHSLEASWLAQEGAEALRGLRDTNWIRYGYDKKECWHSTSNTECDPGGIHMLDGSKENPSQYILTQSLTQPPTLEQATEPLVPDLGPEDTKNTPFLLYYYDLDDSVDFDGDSVEDNDKQYIAPDFAPYTQVEPTKFYRQIQTYEVGKGYIEGLITVAWYEGSKPYTINLPVTLTNYQIEE